MYRLVFVFALCTLTNAKKFYKFRDFEAYYWKDFGLAVPPDALVAGESKNRQPVYIVQVLHKNLLIPGKLDEDHEEALYEYNDTAWTSNRNIKILCTNFPYLFQWYTTSHSTFENDKTYVVGGYEPDQRIYIGKGERDEEVLIGKVVFSKEEEFVYLHTTHKGKPLRLNNFQVLQFTPLYLDHYTIYSLTFKTHPPLNVLYDAYYWRDFKDTVPSDAFSAGLDQHGKSIYIVQVLHEDRLIPGTLDVDQNQAVYVYEMEQWRAKDQFKILCSHYPQYIMWQQPSFFFISPTKNKNVIGGYELAQLVYIGRAVKDNQYTIGKVTSDEDYKPSTLHSIYDGQCVKLKYFSVLGINLSNENTTTNIPINYRIATSNATASITIPNSKVEAPKDEEVLKPNLRSLKTRLNPTHNTNDSVGERYYFINIY